MLADSNNQKAIKMTGFWRKGFMAAAMGIGLLGAASALAQDVTPSTNAPAAPAAEAPSSSVPANTAPVAAPVPANEPGASAPAATTPATAPSPELIQSQTPAPAAAPV
ncbi:hypothetical protein M3187_23615, partial [Mesobacillus subterraneus]|nr:hypothetical protein [Mesobacillus subterraneus]